MKDDRLPLKKNGQTVHAGFWPRFQAIWVDLIVMLPFIVLFLYLGNFYRTFSFIHSVPYALLFYSYRIYFHARWGATIGKMVTGIRVTRLDGSPIGYREALKRFSVDAVFVVALLIAQQIALAHMTNAEFDALSWRERTRHFATLMPAWNKPMEYLRQVWFWGEFIVLLSNKRRRALHDFIAGTVVIKKKYVQQNKTVGEQP